MFKLEEGENWNEGFIRLLTLIGFKKEFINKEEIRALTFSCVPKWKDKTWEYRWVAFTDILTHNKMQLTYRDGKITVKCV